MKNNYFVCVISKEAFGEYAAHQIQASGCWTSNPYGDAFAIVPGDMVDAIMETHGFCDLVLNEDGTQVVSFTAREIPDIPDPETEPTADDILNAMLGVE